MEFQCKYCGTTYDLKENTEEVKRLMQAELESQGLPSTFWGFCLVCYHKGLHYNIVTYRAPKFEDIIHRPTIGLYMLNTLRKAEGQGSLPPELIASWYPVENAESVSPSGWAQEAEARAREMIAALEREQRQQEEKKALTGDITLLIKALPFILLGIGALIVFTTRD